MKKTFYQLPPEQCERLRASEMAAMRWLTAAVHIVAEAQDDLATRLECIPNGKSRYRLMRGHLRAIVNDICGTMPEKQKNQIVNMTRDMELRMVPRYSPGTARMILNKEEANYLVDHAKADVCSACILNGEECRTCEMYQMLEAITPLEDWGDSTMCPYNRKDWKDK